MNDQTYRTPEGFELYRPLLFPEVTDLAQLFTVERPWDFATMNHHNGYAQAATPAEITREGWERTVSRFLAVDGLPGGRHVQVTPTDLLLDKVYTDENDFAFFDRVECRAIYHQTNDRLLIVASASRIIASRYLAYIDPAAARELVSE